VPEYGLCLVGSCPKQGLCASSAHSSESSLPVRVLTSFMPYWFVPGTRSLCLVGSCPSEVLYPWWFVLDQGLCLVGLYSEQGICFSSAHAQARTLFFNFLLVYSLPLGLRPKRDLHTKRISEIEINFH
jgi:hypothetical protein